VYELTWIRVGIGHKMTWVPDGKVEVNMGTS